jgi:hypothetical protein
MCPLGNADVDRILSDLFKWDQPEVDAHLETVVGAAEDSGGGVSDESQARG